MLVPLTLALMLHSCSCTSDIHSKAPKKYQVMEGTDFVLPCTPSWYNVKSRNALPQVLEMEYVRKSPKGRLKAHLDHRDIYSRYVEGSIISSSGAEVGMFLHPRPKEFSIERILDMSITLYIQKFGISDTGMVYCTTNGEVFQMCISTSIQDHCPTDFKYAFLWSTGETPGIVPGTVINGKHRVIYKVCYTNATHDTHMYWLQNKAYLSRWFDPWASAIELSFPISGRTSRSQFVAFYDDFPTSNSLNCTQSGVFWCDHVCRIPEGQCRTVRNTDRALAFNILPRYLSPFRFEVTELDEGYQISVNTNGPPSVKAMWEFSTKCVHDVQWGVDDQSENKECYRERYTLEYKVGTCNGVKNEQLVKLSLLTIYGYWLKGEGTTYLQGGGNVIKYEKTHEYVQESREEKSVLKAFLLSSLVLGSVVLIGLGAAFLVRESLTKQWNRMNGNGGRDQDKLALIKERSPTRQAARQPYRPSNQSPGGFRVQQVRDELLEKDRLDNSQDRNVSEPEQDHLLDSQQSCIMESQDSFEYQSSNYNPQTDRSHSNHPMSDETNETIISIKTTSTTTKNISPGNSPKLQSQTVTKVGHAMVTTRILSRGSSPKQRSPKQRSPEQRSPSRKP